MNSDAIFLVTGATGTQGGATARALVNAGRRVRALVRDADAAAAKALEQAGCELAVGDFEQPDALRAALDGVSGVFSVQRPDLTNTNSERRHGFALIEAALDAGVGQFIHSSVCQLDDHTRFPRWDEGYWSVSYWTDKAAVEQKLREAGFARWTMLRPSFIMENFTRAKAQFLYPQLRDGVLLTPIHPNSPIQLIAADDIGAFAAAAVAEPDRFAGKAIELAGDELTIDGIATILQDVLGVPVSAQSVDPDVALAAGLGAAWVRSQEWINDVGYHVDRTLLDAYGVPLTSFRAWVESHRQAIDIQPGGGA